MQFKQTSSPTGSSALSLSSEAINSKFKEVPESLSVRLLSGSYSGHSFNSRSGLVDSGNEVQLFKRNLYSQAKCSHFYRLSNFAWGTIQNHVKIQGLWKESQLGWHINIKELMAAFLALQLLVPNYWNGHIQLLLT